MIVNEGRIFSLHSSIPMRNGQDLFGSVGLNMGGKNTRDTGRGCFGLANTIFASGLHAKGGT